MNRFYLLAQILCTFSALTVAAEDYEYVDLGLSVKWATKNVGANSITDFGDFFAWGEVSPKEEYDWTTYKYTEEKATRMTKYCNSSLGAVQDFKYVLDASDDAATTHWGGNWRMPTLQEMNELFQNCSWVWHTNYEGSGIAGFLVRSKMSGYSDKFIFFPAAGHMGGKNAYDTNQKGMYWTSSLNFESFASIKAAQLYFGSDGYLTMSYDRQIGMTVRPVFDDREIDESPKQYDVDGQIGEHHYVDLGLSVKWATANVGADIPMQGGDLFAWGETSTKDVYSPKTYKYSIDGRSDLVSKYNKKDSLITLEPSDDAATCNWGEEWRTPTIDEWNELINNCDWYISDGILGISRVNGRRIVLSRFTGCKDDYTYHTTIEGGHYWSANNSTVDKHRGCAMICKYYLYTTSNINRYWGMAIRPVLNNGSTGIRQFTDNVKPSNKDGIYLIKGKLKIIHDGKTYNLNGHLEKNSE